MRVFITVFIMAGLIGCAEKEKPKPDCNPSSSQVIFRAKCYMEGNLIYDADVVCPVYHQWYIDPVIVYDKQSGSQVATRSDGIKCFVLRKPNEFK